MNKLALTMIVKNESNRLSRCLKSVANAVDEIIIVDTGSIDDTKQVAISYGAKVFEYQWNDNFSEARNFALKHSTSAWNLILDADEYMESDSKQKLREFIYQKNTIGKVKIINKFDQDGEVKQSQAHLSRLLPRGLQYSGRIHEQVVSDYPRINSGITVYHDGYFQTDKSKRNLGLLQKELDDNPLNDYILYQIAKQYRLMKQFDKAEIYFEKCYELIPFNISYRPNLIIDYLYNIISNGNFERGLYLISKEKKNLNEHPDFHFVSGLFYMEQIFKNPSRFGHMLPMIEKEYLSCLELGDTENYDSVIGTGSFLASYNLGVFYETTGNLNKAKVYYEKSANYNYERALQRLNYLKR